MSTFIFIIKLMFAAVIIICAGSVIFALIKRTQARGNFVRRSAPATGVSYEVRRGEGVRNLFRRIGERIRALSERLLSRPADGFAKPSGNSAGRSIFKPSSVRIGTDTKDDAFGSTLVDPDSFWGVPADAHGQDYPECADDAGYILSVSVSNCGITGSQLGGARLSAPAQSKLHICKEHLPLSFGRQCSRGNYINLADPTVHHQNHLTVTVENNELRLRAADNAIIFDRNSVKTAQISAGQTYTATDSVFSVFIGAKKTLIEFKVYKSGIIRPKDRFVLRTEISPASTTDDTICEDTLFQTLGTFSVGEGDPVSTSSILAGNRIFMNNPGNRNYIRESRNLFDIRSNGDTFTAESISLDNCLFMTYNDDGSICPDKRFRLDVDAGSVFIACVKQRFYRISVEAVEHEHDFGECYTA